MPNLLLTHPPRRPLIAASILGADFARLADDCRAAVDAGSDLLHLDVMDGHFVPNLTMGPALCRCLRRALPDVCLDVHLMVTDPAAYIEPFADAGADHLTVHVEAEGAPRDLAGAIRDAGMTAGIAISPPSPVEQVLPYVEDFDLILVMSVNPGFAGQAFMPVVLAKSQLIAPMLRDDQRLQVDGGVGAATAGACIDAGHDVLVAASAIFRADDYADAIATLRAGGRGEAESAGGTGARSVPR